MSLTVTLEDAVEAVRAGHVSAFRTLVEATEQMAYAVAWSVMRREPEARDVVQQAYLVAFERLGELRNRASFAGWLRRIVIATAQNHRRRVRDGWIQLDEEVAPPVLDEAETSWSAAQHRQLARALLSLSEEERRLCERHYYGRWPAERLAGGTPVDAARMRKRLQRIRDKLRKEIEMDEERALGSNATPKDLPANIMALLARPRLMDLPENPVGATLAVLRGAFAGYSVLPLPEEVNLDAARRQLGGDAVYIEPSKLHWIREGHALRYDLTLPLLLAVRWTGTAQRLTAAGKVYRRETESATHLEAFHQLECFAIDERARLDLWTFAGRILDAVDRLLPRSEIRVSPTEYPMCRRAFSLDVLSAGRWVELLAWGEYADWVLEAMGADPAHHLALGAGFGLDRLAALKYDIDDIRKVASASVA